MNCFGCKTCGGTGCVYRTEETISKVPEGWDNDVELIKYKIGGLDICPECLYRAEEEYLRIKTQMAYSLVKKGPSWIGTNLTC